MATFLGESRTSAKLTEIIESAQHELILVSPYIKLNDRLKAAMKRHLQNPELRIMVLFGKNYDDKSKSVALADLEFFKQFPNVTILHEPRLHAKYYANESDALITSMNLYDFSLTNNVEVGIHTRRKGLVNGAVGNLIGMPDMDLDAGMYFLDIIEHAEKLFVKTPVYQKANLGLTKRWTGNCTIELDVLDQHYKGTKSTPTRRFGNQPDPSATVLAPPLQGHCIRTGTQIPFNVERPFCDEAYKNWNKYANPDYAEKFCHYSGEPSNGQTSKKRPILAKNWSAAKNTFGF